LGNAGNDCILGLAGDDTIEGGNGNDTLLGNDGLDSILGAGGNNILDGGNGNDTIIGGDGTDSLSGGNDADSLVGGISDFQTLSGDAGADTLVAGGGVGQELYGGTENDSLLGSAVADWMAGGEDNDTLQGGSGNDTLLGGSGNDSIDAGNHSDSVLGEDGDDTIFSATSVDTDNDTIIGGNGNDWVSYANITGATAATINLVSGAVVGYGADSLQSIENVIGSSANDSILGDSGANTILGGDGTDSLLGGAGNDWLDYGAGDEQFDFVAGVTTGNMTLIGGDGQDTLNLGLGWFAAQAGAFTNWTQDAGTQTIYSQGWESVVCFAEGTRIVTPNGEDAVENLRAGDMVLAMRDGQAGFEALRWVGFMDVAVPRNAAMAAKTAPILIKAGAIAPGMPARDLRVSPDHAMEVDGHLIPAKHLVNGESIIQETWCRKVRYFHLELEAHGLLLSEGTWSESYLDDGNRHAFNNAAMTALFLDFEAGRSAGQYDERACLPVLRQGLKLDEIHGRLALRAEAMVQEKKVKRG
jgi:Ca2+-binding RTX toxin-like protein